MTRFFGFTAVLLLLLSGFSAQAEEAPALRDCILDPDVPCLMDAAEVALDESFSPDDALRADMVRTYLQMKQPAPAFINARQLSDASIAIPLLLDAALLYWEQGESQRARNLWEELPEHFVQLKDTGCTHYQPLLLRYMADYVRHATDEHAFPPTLKGTARLRDATRLLLIEEALEGGNRTLASEWHTTLETDDGKDKGILLLATARLASESPDKLDALVSTVKNKALLKEYRTYTVPTTLLVQDRKEDAIYYTHGISDVPAKIRAFMQLVDMIRADGDAREAQHMLGFVRDIVERLPTRDARISLYMRLAELYLSLDHLTTARLMADKAFSEAFRTEAWPERLEAVLGIMQQLESMGDTKSVLSTGLHLINNNLLSWYDEQYDTLTAEDRTRLDRFMEQLSGHVSSNGKLRLIQPVLPLHNRNLREDLLDHIARMKTSPRIKARYTPALWVEVDDALKNHPYLFETIEARIIMAGVLFSEGKSFESAKLFDDIALSLKNPAVTDLPAAAVRDYTHATWRSMAMQKLQQGRVKDAVSDMQHAGPFLADAPYADAWLQGLIQHDAITEALLFFPVTQVAVEAGIHKKMEVMLHNIIQQESELAQTQLLELIPKLANEQAWDAVIASINALEKMDEARWFSWNRILEKPSPAIAFAAAQSFAHAGNTKKAAFYANKIIDASRQAEAFYTIVHGLLAPKQEAEPPQPITPLLELCPAS